MASGDVKPVSEIGQQVLPNGRVHASSSKEERRLADEMSMALVESLRKAQLSDDVDILRAGRYE